MSALREAATGQPRRCRARAACGGSGSTFPSGGSAAAVTTVRVVNSDLKNTLVDPATNGAFGSFPATADWFPSGSPLAADFMKPDVGQDTWKRAHPDGGYALTTWDGHAG